jgi:hypothetical protein
MFFNWSFSFDFKETVSGLELDGTLGFALFTLEIKALTTGSQLGSGNKSKLMWVCKKFKAAQSSAV